MSNRIRIFRDGVWAGDGSINNDGEIVDCQAVLGPDQDASDETYYIIQAIIEDNGGCDGAVRRPDGVYSWEIVEDLPVWTIQMRDENGVERHAEWPNAPSPQQVKDACQVQWHRMPAYMPQGAFLRIDYSVLDPDMEVAYSGSVEIDLEPDHTHLIGEACERRGCGYYKDMHEWVESAADPGESQCCRCGLRQTWCMVGQHRDVKYAMPNSKPKGDLNDVDAGTVQ